MFFRTPPRFRSLLWLLAGLAWISMSGLASAEDPRTVRLELADGFDFPCGDPVGSGKGYYIYRGWTAGHPGEDWNGNGMGNSDLGDPVYAVARGVVIMSRNVGSGWGKTVIVRHAFRDPRSGMIDVVDSYYTHMDRLIARYGQMLDRGEQLGTIGTNNGMYTAHLHFEMRHGPGLNIGTHRSRFSRDMRHYHRPTDFIEAHRELRAERRTRARVQVDQFQNE